MSATHAAGRPFPRSGRRVLIACALAAAAAPLQAVTLRPQAARAYGMGSAFSAVANDWSAAFFNPAGLAAVKDVQAAGEGGRFFTQSPFAESGFLGAGTLPLKIYREAWDYGTLGGYLQRASRREDGSVTGLGFAWGALPAKLAAGGLPFPIPDRLQAGVGLHLRDIISSDPAAPPSNFGAGLDLGVLYPFPDGDTPLTRGWSVAAAIQEIDSPGQATPASYRLGAAWKNPQSILAMDMVYEDGVSKLYPGAEISFFKKILELRLGTGYEPGQPRQLTVGLGSLLSPVQIDLAYGFPIGDVTKPNDRFLASFTYRFGAPLLEQAFGQEGSIDANKIASLQAEKDALETSIREQRDLYERVKSGLDQARAKTAASEKQSKDLEDKLAQQKKAIAELEDEKEKLEFSKHDLELKIQQEKAAAATPEVRPPGSPGGPRHHRAVKGDTLRDLAKRYYGNPDLWELIYDANPDKILRGAPKEGADLVIP